MRTHLRRDAAQKSDPTPNREQLRVFYNADKKKTDYILIFFNYYSKVHSTGILPTFWVRRRAEDVGRLTELERAGSHRCR